MFAHGQRNEEDERQVDGSARRQRIERTEGDSLTLFERRHGTSVATGHQFIILIVVYPVF